MTDYEGGRGRWLLAVVLSVSPPGAFAAGPRHEPATRAAVSDGHARMVAELERIRDEAAQHNPYVGSGALDALWARLAQLSDDPTDPRRARLQYRLGIELLRMGRTDEAVAAFSRAVEFAESSAGKLTPGDRADVYFQLGTAYLRLAEDRNCCASNNAQSCILPIEGGGLHRDKTGSQNAVGAFTKALELAPPASPLHVKARWLLNVAMMTLDAYPDGVPEAYRIDPDVFASGEAFPRFVDVALSAGLDHADLAGGLVVEDLDGDGRLDVLTSTSDPAGGMQLYRNDGTGRLPRRTAEANLSGMLGGLNLVSGDYDGDGDVDVLVLRGAWWRMYGRHPKSLLRNDGRGVFTDVTFESGLGGSRYPSQAAAFADYDNDGDLDLFIGNESDPANPSPCELYRNDGEGGFVDVAAAAGVTNDRFTKAAVWGDCDGDRFPDLYLTNMAGLNRLYRNERDGTFTDVAEAAGVGLPISAFPSWFFDFDNDGALDLWVGGYGGPNDLPSVADVAASYLDLPHRGEVMRLYRGDGRGGFSDVAPTSGLDLYTLPMGANFGDLDNDGYLDFYLGTGYPYYEGLVPNVMYRNRRGKGFADVTTAGGFGHLQKGHGVAFADLDEDGDQDVIMKMGGAFPGDPYRCLLFRNPGFGAHWIKVRLVGERSNRFGVGASIRVDLVEGGVARSIHRTVGTGGSFGCGSLRQEIGLGSASRIERLEVFWPTTGERQVFEDVGVDQTLEVHEGRKELVRTTPKAFVIGG